MLTTIPARPTWAGTRDTSELALAARVVDNPLTGQIPTWGDPGRLVYDLLVAELGDPFTLDARIAPLPPATGEVVAAEPVTRSLRVVEAVAEQVA